MNKNGVTSKPVEGKMGNKLQRGKVAKKKHGKLNIHVCFCFSHIHTDMTNPNIIVIIIRVNKLILSVWESQIQFFKTLAALFITDITKTITLKGFK